MNDTVQSLLLPVVESNLPRLSRSSDDELLNMFLPSLRAAGLIEGFSGGDRFGQIKTRVSQIVDSAIKTSGKAASEFDRYLSDESTLDNAERLTLLIAILFSVVPELRELPAPVYLALLIFELRQRKKKKHSP
jgi:hypothetical protein